MNPPTAILRTSGRRTRYMYWAILFLAALSGFAQMPIFKRYYIADIPGLGWLAAFYTTHVLHYIGAVLILGLGGYLLTDQFFGAGRSKKISPTGWMRGILLSGIVFTGIGLVIRNSFYVPFNPETIIVLSWGHLGLGMFFLFFSLYCSLARKTWTLDRPH